MIKMSAVSIYVGGADTVSAPSPVRTETYFSLLLLQTVSAELSFILAMALYPDVQAKAKAEIDAVVGHDRFPTNTDFANMPYLNAMYLEILRWNQVVPLGVCIHVCALNPRVC